MSLGPRVVVATVDPLTAVRSLYSRVFAFFASPPPCVLLQPLYLNVPVPSLTFLHSSSRSVILTLCLLCPYFAFFVFPQSGFSWRYSVGLHACRRPRCCEVGVASSCAFPSSPLTLVLLSPSALLPFPLLLSYSPSPLWFSAPFLNFEPVAPSFPSYRFPFRLFV